MGIKTGASIIRIAFLIVERHFINMGLFGVLVVIFVGTSVFLTSARPTAGKVIIFYAAASRKSEL